DRLHSDDEKFTDRLIKILKPELRSDLGRRKSKPELSRARIDVRQRRGLGLKAEFGHRYCNKRHVHFRGADGKGGSRENFPSRVSDATTCGVQRVTERKRICKGPHRNRLPHRNSDGGSNRHWRHIDCWSLLEHQAVLQDISRRALGRGFAREQDDARGAEHRSKVSTAAVPSDRTMRYGVVIDV